MKVTIFKVAADGEQIQIEVPLTREHHDQLAKGARLRDILKHAFDLADDRLLEFNVRIMKMNRLCSQLSPEQQMAVKSVLEVHAGQGAPVTQSVHDQAVKDYNEIAAEMSKKRDEAEARAKKHAKKAEEAPQ